MRSLLLFIIVLLAACSDAKKAQFEEERLKRAEEFVVLVANYTSKTAQAQFDSARTLLSEEGLKTYGQKILNEELSAIQSSGRSQTFQIAPEGKDYQIGDNSKATVAILGHRTRKVGSKQAKPIELAYFLTFKNGSAKEAVQISAVDVQLSSGQVQAIAEEKLLEKFNEASGAAKTERKKFVEAVKMVSEDLKAHEEKVEKDFNRLSTSLDKLGGTVRKLKDEAVEMQKRRQAPAKTTPNASDPPVKTSTSSSSQAEQTPPKAATPSPPENPNAF